MSEAALEARRKSAIKSAGKRSQKIHDDALMEGIYPANKQGVEPKRKIKVEGEPKVIIPQKERKVVIDFFEHPELFEQLIQIAEVEMRSLDNLIIYFLKRGDFSSLHAVIN